MKYHKSDDRALRRVYIAIETLIADKPVPDQLDEMVAVVMATLLLLSRDEKVSLHSLLDQFATRLQKLSLQAAAIHRDEAERLQ